MFSPLRGRLLQYLLSRRTLRLTGILVTSSRVETTKKNKHKKSGVNNIQTHFCTRICFWLGATWGRKEIPIHRIPEGITGVAADCWMLKDVKNEICD